ncbi:glucosaminidase domain-containing protein [Propionibacteriaceae bacterium G57]|uniref:glucosaminidase domain-containing protein n=1 Tax=Aestuariimicrobium sp. G57 TaxID=3418485 RepID=UPI003DA6D553
MRLPRLRHSLIGLVSLALMGTGLVAATAPTASAATDAEVEVFLATLAPGAKDSWYRFGVPASVTLAQAALESGWGSSKLSGAPNNNYFGIKCGRLSAPWDSPYQNGCVAMVTTEYDSSGRAYQITDWFRTYASPAMSMVDHGYYLKTRGLYDKAFLVNEDPVQFAVEVRKGGYATDPNYANLLKTLMDQRNMYRFDWRTGVGSAPSAGVGGAATKLATGGVVKADDQLPNTPPVVLAKRAGLDTTGLTPVAEPSSTGTSSAPATTNAPASTASVPASPSAPASTAAAAASSTTGANREYQVQARPLPSTGA